MYCPHTLCEYRDIGSAGIDCVGMHNVHMYLEI